MLLEKEYAPISIIDGTKLYTNKEITTKLQEQMDALLVAAELTNHKCEGFFFSNKFTHRYYILFIGNKITLKFELTAQDQIENITLLTISGACFTETNYKHFPNIIALAKFKFKYLANLE